MEVIKYSDFLILEAKKQKEEVEQAILDMLDKKPEVETSKWWPNEKGIYSQGGIFKHLKDRFSDNQVTGALGDLGSKVKHISVKNSEYKGSYPYYFVGSSDEANKIKAKYEEEDKGKQKDKPVAKKPVAKEKPKPKRVSPSAKSPVKKKEKKK